MLLRARPGDRVLSGGAAGLALISVVCCLASAVLHPMLLGDVDVPRLAWSDVVLGTVYPLAGAVVLRSRPRHAVGWVLVSASLIGPYLLFATLGGWSLLVRPEPLPLTDLALWFAVWGFVPYFYVLPLALLLFPDGRPATPRWRPAVIGVAVIATITIGTRMISRIQADIVPQATNPLGLVGPPFQYVTLFGSFTLLFGGTALGLLSLRTRARRAAGTARAQLQWLSLGGLALLVGLVGSALAGESGVLNDFIFAAGLAGPPLAIAVAMVRHRLFDVEFALNRTIVFVLLSAIVVGVYVGVVVAVGSIAPSSTLGVTLVAVVAVIAASGRNVVQAGVDRWLFGHRRDPYAVVARVGRHVAAASEPLEALQRLVDALRDALRLPYVAFDGALTVTSGEAVAGWHTEPAFALGQQVGELHAGFRKAGERFSAEEKAAIAEVGSRAATLAYAASLVDDVAQSRARIVLAREEERRRLRADLHDGVGPTLAGTAHQMDALARRMSSGPSELHDRAVEIRERLRDVVGDVRAVTHGLRPPVLDHVGLAGALRRLLDGFDVPECTVSIDAWGDLPAAVEVAAYAIASEAMSNAVRHSAAGRIHLDARVEDGSLVVSVSDNGRGMPARTHGGLGLISMGERAVEVGGRLDVIGRPGGGTIVRAFLPVETA
jgi:signal transduction histidine kinase